MTREEYFKQELARCEEEWTAGRLDALLDAVVLCSGEHPLPEWASLAVVNALRLSAAGYPLAEAGRGRTGNVVSKLAQDDIHRSRWDLARWALGESCLGLDAAGRKLTRREIGKVYGFSAGTRPEAFMVASMLLRGTAAQGSEEAVEASYKLVEAAIREGSGARFRVENKPN